MPSKAYYNEIDPDAVAILRELISDDVIAPGDVDDRSIKDVTADDLRGYTQCHFFAGGGLWSVAARMAGWPDERPLWTASCPCQGESVAGRKLGADDPRHLWPDLYPLVRSRRPSVLVGEQVARASGTHWLDRVCADLEDENYTIRSVDIPACAVDAPHQRSRLYWLAVADAFSERDRAVARGPHGDAGGNGPDRHLIPQCRDGGVVYAQGVGRREGWPEHELRGGRAAATGADGAGALADTFGVRRQISPSGRQPAVAELVRPGPPLRNGSWWAGAKWIACHDGKARRTQPGAPLLVDGLPGRVGLWRVAGNAISPVLAAEVIGAFLDTETR